MDEIEDGLLEDDLQGVGDVEVALFQRSAAPRAGPNRCSRQGGSIDVGAVLAPVDDVAERVDVGGRP